MKSDKEITNLIDKGKIRIDPFFPKFLGPNLYYCHLGQNFLIPKKMKGEFNPLRDDSGKFFKKLHTNKPISLKPGQFILAETFEFLGTDDSHIIKLFNSSSFARCGIFQAALGMLNPGCGKETPVKITLELYNSFSVPVILTPTTVNNEGEISWGTEVLKVGVEKMDSKPTNSYSNWKFAAYGKDQKVMSSRMNNRFGSDKDIVINKEKYTT
ncbi:MAG: putative deoxycytidine triphosphate deaminase [Candidatus Collierbacteria bacterium GW2011_GWC2_44_18]|uniref:Putative deoxycytidine triphosphate deaminase n=1 Tax=Candidatus Collierbacteria bacterium GW2011_GWC2_44_18 TaxID=1618392 RepID=A0A0G1HP71_9BACT|nr:MAG: putative deoxycytidine triphosphate deaminase [Candidatus Collierbacteria bacterium GW2011_GWC2_44_18]